MSALDVLGNLVSTNLINNNLKYCLVDTNKLPYTITGVLAKPNCDNDFVDFDKLLSVNDIDKYAGIGISIKASDISAIDIDGCFTEPFDFNTIDDRGLDIYNIFKNLAYIEFSFSGKGMRILFKQKSIDNYSNKYYTKNSKNHIEFYQPSGSARYVTITGKYLSNISIDSKIDFSDTIIYFLDKYMLKPKKLNIDKNSQQKNENKTFDQLKNLFKYHCFKDINFQNNVFSYPSGSGGNESETDYAIISYIYHNITTDKDMINKLFMDTFYYKHKDKKHINKWLSNNYRYLNYIYDHLD